AVVRLLPLSGVLTINVQPAGAEIVGVPEPVREVIDATMTSLASVPEGLLMASDVALLAPPLLALTAPRNPMLVAPGQVSAASHSLTAARHTVPGGWLASAGQVTLVPVQVSATSHGPGAARQTVPAAERASAGQETVEPVHFSATSHGPAEARQTVLDDRKPSAGQVALVPVHVSAASDRATGRGQNVRDRRTVSVGQDRRRV